MNICRICNIYVYFIYGCNTYIVYALVLVLRYNCVLLTYEGMQVHHPIVCVSADLPMHTCRHIYIQACFTLIGICRHTLAVRVRDFCMDRMHM